MNEQLLEQAKQLGLLEEEYKQICEILGREPNFTEISIFSVMWSEHCSYKNSIVWLKTLPKEGSKMLAEAGEENAGLVDIGDGLACCFKIESHNHPSFIEPYQGAATGVGGIMRDVFTMGARPIANLNSIHFGFPQHKKTKNLLRGVVHGIGGYGNCMGVPTIAGQTSFDSSYNGNILVNAMTLGLVKKNKINASIILDSKNPDLDDIMLKKIDYKFYFKPLMERKNEIMKLSSWRCSRPPALHQAQPPPCLDPRSKQHGLRALEAGGCKRCSPSLRAQA